jgi:hypothetical protein
LLLQLFNVESHFFFDLSDRNVFRLKKTQLFTKLVFQFLGNYISRRLVSCLNFKLFSLEGTFHRR